LNQDAGPVAGQGIGADGAPVVQIDENAQTPLDDVVAGCIFNVGDETNATGVAIVVAVVKPLPFGAVIVFGPAIAAHAAYPDTLALQWGSFDTREASLAQTISSSVDQPNDIEQIIIRFEMAEISAKKRVTS